MLPYFDTITIMRYCNKTANTNRWAENQPQAGLPRLSYGCNGYSNGIETQKHRHCAIAIYKISIEILDSIDFEPDSDPAQVETRLKGNQSKKPVRNMFSAIDI